MPVLEHTFVRSWEGDPADLLTRLRTALEQAGFRLSAPSQWTFHGERSSQLTLTKLDRALVVRAAVTQDSDGTVAAQVHLADKMPDALRAVTFERGLWERFAQIERAVDVALGFAPPPFPTAQPAARTQPGATAQPAATTQPGATAQPPATTQPAATAQPAAGVAATHGVVQPPQHPAPETTSVVRAGPAIPDTTVDPNPAATPGTTAPAGTSQEPDGIVDRASAALGQLGEKTREKTSAILGRDSAEPWQKVDSVTFWCPPDQAVADATRLQLYAAVAAMVASQPGALPDKLAGELTRFVEHVRGVLDAAARADMKRVRCDMETSQRPILEFLEQQARMRDQLPVRTLHRCIDCGQQKVSNPDYLKLKERNRKMQALTGAAGLTLRGGTVSPFLVVGALFRLRKLDPDYVCGRCQGMQADERIVTFCPQCGELCADAVLRRCSKCNHDLRSDLGPLELWEPAQ